MPRIFLLLLIANCLFGYADAPPVLLPHPDPNAGISKIGVVFDAAEVELTVDAAGVPFSLVSSIGLPEYLANAIETWRYSPMKKGGRTVPFATRFMVLVARKITPVTERSLGVFWRIGDDDQAVEIKRGRTMTDSEADKLAAQLTETDNASDIRTALLVHYAGGAADSAKAKLQRSTLLAWMITHDPANEILASPFAVVNSIGEPLADADSAKRLTEMWLAAVDHSPEDSKIALHAVNFLRVTNPLKAMQVVAGRYNGKNDSTERAGDIYAIAALGIKSVSPISGGALLADDPPSSSFSATAREKLLHSDDAKMVLTGMLTVIRSGRSLEANHALPDAYKDLCTSLLAHARTFYPETAQTCEPAGPADDGAVPVSLDQKLMGAKLDNRVPPVYPQQAKDRHVTGTVHFTAIISRTGEITELGYTDGPLLLYHSSLAAVRKWKYKPTELNGKAVDISTEITVTYTMSP